MVIHFRNLVECHRAGRQDTFSPIELTYRVQTALIMGMLAFRAGTTAKFDAAKEEIIV